jgi:hypothetical protein
MVDNNQAPDKEIFNMSLDILQRIGDLLTCCAKSIIEDDFDKWYSYIRALRQQISYKFTSDEKAIDALFLDILNMLIPEFSKKMIWNSNKRKFVIRNNEEYTNYGLLRNVLEGYQDFLQDAMGKRGMLFRTERDASKSSIDL